MYAITDFLSSRQKREFWQTAVDICEIEQLMLPHDLLAKVGLEWPCNSYYAERETNDLFMQWCTDNGILWQELLLTMYAVFFKKKTFVLIGAAGTSKSYWTCKAVCKGIEDYVGCLSLTGSNMQFAFQDCVDPVSKQVICIEESCIPPEALDGMKCIFGGEPYLCQRKAKTSKKLNRTPIFFTANQDIWKTDAFEQRMFIF